MTREEANTVKELAKVVDSTQITYNWFCGQVDNMVNGGITLNELKEKIDKYAETSPNKAGIFEAMCVELGLLEVDNMVDEDAEELTSEFMENTGCAFYPCHKLDKINCLFCFCPLYKDKNCLGTPKYINGVKDCSDCTFPHKKENYKKIMERLRNDKS